MAGDWVKFEHATLAKAEVGMLANLLGVERPHAVGLLLQFWVWFDQNAADGRVRFLSGKRPDGVLPLVAKSLDDTMHCVGFAVAMNVIGWLEIDESEGFVGIPRHERHNGNSAKNRALDNKRKAENRVREMSGSEPEQSRTREEKRREELTTTTTTTPAPLRSAGSAKRIELPDWMPEVWSDFAAARSSRKGWTPKAQALCIRELGKLRAAGHDPAAVIEQSIRNGWAGLFPLRAAVQSKADKSAAVAEAMYGSVLREIRGQTDDSSIPGESTRVA